MIIQDIKIAGFRSRNKKTGLDISSLNNGGILSARGANKKFLLNVMLGIIYGFNKNEKNAFRDKNSLIFTGRVDIRFDNKTLYIERDFETDIVAVLSQGKIKTTPVFQGKDLFSTDSERPYLEFLRSIFSIDDKETLIQLCRNALNSEQATFGEVLDNLYLFLRPKFKIATIKRLISSSKKVISFTNSNGSKDTNNLQKAINHLHLLKNAKKIAQSNLSLESDISRLEKFWDGIQISYNTQNKAHADLKQRFPLIYQMDAYELKKDISYLNALQKSKKTLQTNLQEMERRKAEFELLLNKKLLVYADLPDTFVEDFHEYQDLSMELAKIKNDYDKQAISYGNLQTDLQIKKRSSVIIQFLFTIPAILATYFLLPHFLLYSLLAIFVTSLLIAFSFRKMKNKILESIENSDRTQANLKIKIEEIESSLLQLRSESFLLDDFDYIDTHIERYKKYHKVKSNTVELNKGILELKKKLQNEKYTIDLPELERRYKDLLNLNPPEGLTNYIDDFELMQKKAKSSKNIVEIPEKIKPVKEILSEYKKINTDLCKTKVYIEDYLAIEDLEKNIDLHISNLERAITDLKQKIQLEKATH